MNKFLQHLLVMVFMMIVFLFAAWLILLLLDRFGSSDSLWVTVAGAGIAASPVLGLLVIELALGRAFGWGFSVVHRRDDAREYWSYIGFHLLLFVVVIGTILFRHCRSL